MESARAVDRLTEDRALLERIADFFLKKFGIEGLVDVAVGAVEGAREGVDRLANAGEHQHARVGERCDILPNFLTNFPAAHARHHHVEDHEIGEALAGELPRLFAIFCADHVDARLGHASEVELDELAHRRLVVGHKHEGGGMLSHMPRDTDRFSAPKSMPQIGNGPLSRAACRRPTLRLRQPSSGKRVGTRLVLSTSSLELWTYLTIVGMCPFTSFSFPCMSAFVGSISRLMTAFHWA